MWGADGFKSIKSIFGVARLAVPVLYCGYLAYYFFDVGGSVQGVEDTGLGPTVIGLGVVALLFCIPLGLKAVRFFTGPRAPGPRSAGPRTGAPTNDDDDDGGAAADAIIARYMAHKAQETKAGAARAAPKSGPAKPSFGRKV